MNMLPIFVYGTLKRGERSHRVLERKYKAVFEAELLGALYDIGPFPMADIRVTDLTIRGELYYLRQGCYIDTLWDLDCMEGVNIEEPNKGFYRRAITCALVMDGTIPQVLVDKVYIYAAPESRIMHEKIITEGVWRGSMYRHCAESTHR